MHYVKKALLNAMLDIKNYDKERDGKIVYRKSGLMTLQDGSEVRLMGGEYVVNRHSKFL
jgi:hypothetical protein